METLKLLFEHYEHVLLLVTSIITIASLITAGTKTPKEGTLLYKLYKLVETLALVIGKAKDQGK